MINEIDISLLKSIYYALDTRVVKNIESFRINSIITIEDVNSYIQLHKSRIENSLELLSEEELDSSVKEDMEKNLENFRSRLQVLADFRNSKIVLVILESKRGLLQIFLDAKLEKVIVDTYSDFVE